MEKQRRLVSGRLSEMFGEKTIGLDKFSLTVGYRRIAKKTWEGNSLSSYSRGLLQAYADGINDYVQNYAMLLPPEFIMLGIEFEEWHPIDTLALMRLVNFHLSWNWSQDLLRDVFSKLELNPEEFVPFTKEHAHELVTILDDEDMRQIGLYDEKTLLERYKNKTPYISQQENIDEEKMEEERKRIA